ncbi:urea transporter [Kocuria tytonis]|uniref:Urea transporter n=1 Tax=Kocuria tytonis TaxID=2054280 RepID=A0A495A9W7_9MICC|nr:urea transporter [Kocuria tytonis]RKQ35337.1 urea transporter [Kocuria tytonis]
MEVLRAVGTVLRGVSQIFFIDNVWSGALIVLAVGWVHPWIAVAVVLGALAQTLGAWALLGRESVRTGMMGYNGALVGAAAAAALNHPVPALLMAVVGALACVPVHGMLQRLFGSRTVGWAALPVATAPFCLVAGVLFDLVLPLVGSGTPTTGSGVPGVALGALNSFSEVVLADGAVPGALIVIALFVGGIRIGLFGLLGSLVALAGALLAGDGVVQASSGLLGYSAVLVSIALGAVVWNDRPLWARITGAVVGVALTMVLQPLLAVLPVPVYTWPFLLSMWLLMLVVAAVTRTRRAAGGTPRRTAVAPIP